MSKENKVQKAIQLPPEIWDKIDKKSKQEARNRNTMIEWAFINYLKNNPI